MFFVLCFSVTRGIGELDVNQSLAPSRGDVRVDDNSPYLILDIRETDEYNQCHLISGNLAVIHYVINT